MKDWTGGMLPVKALFIFINAICRRQINFFWGLRAWKSRGYDLDRYYTGEFMLRNYFGTIEDLAKKIWKTIFSV